MDIYSSRSSIVYCHSLHPSSFIREPSHLLTRNTSLFGNNHGKCSTMVSSSLHHVTSLVLPIIHRGLSCILTVVLSLEHYDTRERKIINRRKKKLEAHSLIRVFQLAIINNYIKIIFNRSFCLRFSILRNHFSCCSLLNTSGYDISHREIRRTLLGKVLIVITAVCLFFSVSLRENCPSYKRSYIL